MVVSVSIFGMATDVCTLLCLLPKKDVPPLLPKALLLWSITMLCDCLLLLTGRTNDYDRMLTGANVAKLLTGLTLDDRGIPVMVRQASQIGMIVLDLLKPLLCGLNSLHQCAV